MDVGRDASRFAAAATEVLHINRRYPRVARHRQRSTLKARVGAPDDRQAEGTRHAALCCQDGRIAVQHVTYQRQDTQTGAASVQVDVIIRRTNQLRQGVCDPLGDGAIGPTWAGPSKIEAVLGGTLTASEGRFIHYRHKRHSAAQLLRRQLAHQTADGGHWLELVTVDAASDEEVRSGLGSSDGMQSQLQGNSSPQDRNHNA